MDFRICQRERNRWSPSTYSKIVPNKDFNLLAFIFSDLHKMGYDIDKSYAKFKSMIRKEPRMFKEDPDLFFLK